MKKSGKGTGSAGKKSSGKKNKKPELKPKGIQKGSINAPKKDNKKGRDSEISFATESISYINDKESHGVKNGSELIQGYKNNNMDMERTDKFEFGFSFSAQEGELGDESEDTGDLPETLDKVGNRYNPSLSTGMKKNKDFDEIIDGIHITDANRLGIHPEETDENFSEEDEN